SMSPIIAVRGGKPIAVTGGAGGSTIIMGTFWTLLNRRELGQDLAHAVDGPRIDAQLEQEDRGGKLLIEDKRISARVLAELRRRGHRLERLGEYSDLPRVQAAGFRSPRSAVKDAVSDSRTEEGSLAQRRYGGRPAPCGIQHGKVLRETRTAAIVITGGDRGGDYLGCWKASGRRTVLYEQGNVRIGNQYTFLGYPTIAGSRAALVDSTIVTVDFYSGPSVSIVDADLRTGRAHRLDSPRGDNGLDVSALALNRCGTLAYASSIRNNLFANSGHAPDIRVWRGHGAPARLGTGPVDRRSLRLTPRYVQWREAGRRHQARIPGAACR
ncbi:MAG: gamma-glutamyltransferase, partial [Solirubrobacteraceae bacterium]